MTEAVIIYGINAAFWAIITVAAFWAVAKVAINIIISSKL